MFNGLLDLDQHGKVREGFKQAVVLLLGSTYRLDSWLDQFYTARSEIVHDGASADLMFRAADVSRGKALQDTPRYRSLVAYGRQIFQACLGAALSGRRMAGELRLDSQFVTNRERLQRICRTLDDTQGTPEDRIDSVCHDVLDVETYRFIPEDALTVPDVLGAAQRIVSEYVKTSPSEDSRLLDQMRELSGCHWKNAKARYKALRLVQSIVEDMTKSKEKVVLSAAPDARELVARLLQTTWHYCFMYYYDLKRGLEAGNLKDDV